MATFSGGTHPPGNKFTEGVPIARAILPKKVIIPLRQHIGAPAEPIVKAGDKVNTGQKIAEAKGFISTSIHSSITGEVKFIKKYPSPLAREALSVVIEGTGEDIWVDAEKGIDYKMLSSEDIKQKIKDAGIVGLGGAAFPTHVKLSPPPEKKIDTVIINGAECEPYLTADYRLILESPEKMVEGLEIIKKTVGAGKGFIGIEDNKPRAIEVIKNIIKDKNDIEVVVLKTKYPQGAEKQLIKAVLNREVPSGKLPLEVGVVVHNVGTTIAIRNAVVENKPLIERVVTICGSGIREGKNLLVRIGTSFKELIDECGGLCGKVTKVIMGGPMMGFAQYSLDVPVVKGTSGVLVLTENEKVPVSENNCIRCGRCLEACPMHLMPNMIGLYAGRFMLEEAFKYRPLDCMECGSCSFVCPARIPLVQLLKFTKSKKLAEMRKK